MSITNIGIWDFRLPERDGYYGAWTMWVGPFLIFWGDPNASPERDVCPHCKNEIDLEWCHCGDRVDTHTIGSGHAPVPMGCTCGYDTSDKGDSK